MREPLELALAPDRPPPKRAQHLPERVLQYRAILSFLGVEEGRAPLVEAQANTAPVAYRTQMGNPGGHGADNPFAAEGATNER